MRLALAESAGAGWGAEPRLAPGRAADAPLLDGATVELRGAPAAAWVATLLGAAVADAQESDAPLAALAIERVDAIALLEAAVRGDGDELAMLAAVAGLAGGDASLAALAPLAVAPLLAPLRRRLAGEVPASWEHGWCPVCGGWPMLAEARGLERERRLRCARCFGDWRFPVLRCPFCDERDHARLTGLAPDGEEEVHRVDACHGCGGFVKAVTTLAALSDEELAAGDLATLPLDLAAIERGFGRPDGVEHAADVRLVAR